MTANKELLIPIDIKDVKLVDWLVDRSIVNRLWNEECSELRDLLKQVGEEECPLIDIAGEIVSPIHYHNAVKILQALEDSPFGTKNLIGQYNHEYTAKWARIVKLFEKDSTFLADSAKYIIQNVKYDIPLFKKQIARATQIKQDSIKKQGDCSNNINKYQIKYREKCCDIGIVGDHVRSELKNLVGDIPAKISDIAGDIGTLQQALSYYQVFARFLINDPDLEVCPLLFFISQHGNGTVSQYETGTLPTPESDSDSSVEIIEPIETHDNNGCVIVSSEMDNDKDSPISMDISNDIITQDPAPEVESDIDFGIDTIDFGADIDFGDDIIDCGDIDFGDDEIEISVMESGEEQKNELVLDNTTTRNKIIDELYELSAFLTSRRDELSRHSENILSEIPECPPEIQTTQIENVENMVSEVDKPLSKLTNDKMRHLLLLKNSEKYLDRLTDRLQSQLRLCDKMEDSIEEMKQRISEAERTYEDVEPKMKRAIETTKLLKACVETELRKKYKGRPVRIMGDINTL
ncbi:CDK5 regulatory subunit-associated protein 3-like [Bolinopsis microptera]|uniref:CDK5 regulatory subunit-associated protein 3-like n=1 Tax=Bolinopsis microptera TaxID=2820187 RepID=UPI00307A1866